MSQRSGSANKTRGVAASSRDTGLTLFDMTTCETSAPTLPALTSSAAGSPAKTCLSLGKALASQASAAVCGLSSRASLAFFDRASSSWRTSQLSCLGGWTSFSETFPKRGMMRSGSISALPTSEPRTGESGSSSSRGSMMWGTARASIGAGDPAKRAARGMLEGQVKMWPTASASLNIDAEALEKWLARAEQLKAKHKNGNGAGMPLAVAAKLAQWTTARSCSATWATITGDAVAMAGERFPNLETVIAQTEAESAIGLALNPAWVESLMGFPAGWTSPITDGPSAPVRPKGHGKRRASRKTDTNGGNG